MENHGISLKTSDDQQQQPKSRSRTLLLDGEYFKLIDVDKSTRIRTIQCLLCGPENNKLLRATIGSCSNLMKHARSVHPTKYLQLRREKMTLQSPTGVKSNKQKPSSSFLTIKQCEVYVEDKSQNKIEEPIHHRIFFSPQTNNNSETNKNSNEISNNNSDAIKTQNEEQSQDVYTTDTTEVEYQPDYNNDDDNSSKVHDTAQQAMRDIEYIDEYDAYDTNNDGVAHDADDGDNAPLIIFNKRRKSLKSLIAGGSQTKTYDPIHLKNELLIREFEETQDMRREKHKLELELIRQEIQFKSLEHKIKLDFLRKKLNSK